jgi:hypothetical protein
MSQCENNLAFNEHLNTRGDLTRHERQQSTALAKCGELVNLTLQVKVRSACICDHLQVCHRAKKKEKKNGKKDEKTKTNESCCTNPEVNNLTHLTPPLGTCLSH